MPAGAMLARNLYPAAMLHAVLLSCGAVHADLLTDYDQFVGLVCSVVHNARGSTTPPPQLCTDLPFMADPTLREAVEEEKVLFTYTQVVSGCAEFARRGDCASRSDVCAAMARQANESSTFGYTRMFYNAAAVWKSGTDTYSGAAHNCHAYGLDGAATDLPEGLPAPRSQIEAAKKAADEIAAACEADHRTGSLRCTAPHHMCHSCEFVAAADISGSTNDCPTGEPLCAVLEQSIPSGLPRALSQYYVEETMPGYTGGLARRVCMDFGACTDAAWMAAGGSSNAIQTFISEVDAFGAAFVRNFQFLAELPRSLWKDEAKDRLVYSWRNRARLLAQAATGLVFGTDPEHTKGIAHAQEALLAAAFTMERQFVAVRESCGVVCVDSLQALTYGAERLSDPAGNKTMNLKEAHEQLRPFSKYSESGQAAEVATEELALLLSLTWEDYALSVQPGQEPTQGAFAYTVAMVVGLPATALRLIEVTT